MRIDRLISTSDILLFLGGYAAQGQDTAQTSAHGPHAPSADGGRAVLYNTLGGYSYRITTSSAEAQRWFDQGLRLVYAFNHLEAQRPFRRPSARRLTARTPTRCVRSRGNSPTTWRPRHSSPTR